MASLSFAETAGVAFGDATADATDYVCSVRHVHSCQRSQQGGTCLYVDRDKAGAGSHPEPVRSEHRSAEAALQQRAGAGTAVQGVPQPSLPARLAAGAAATQRWLTPGLAGTVQNRLMRVSNTLACVLDT